MTKVVLTQRLSPNFILSDFLYAYECYSEPMLARNNVAALDSATLDRATRFCTEFLDPLLAEYGPVSVACGYRHGVRGPHQWNVADGVAADLAFHDWVNENNAPIRLLGEIDQSGAEFERMISYAGSEFVCLAWKPDGGNRSAFYENVRRKGEKPWFITHGKDNRDRQNRIGVPVKMRRDWRREPNEPIHACRSNLRAHHIRVSRYFTLLDMCRNVRAFAAGVGSVLPASLYNSPRVEVARMFGEVLDRVVAAHGQISIVRGLEPVSKLIKGNDPMHYWNQAMSGDVGQAQIVFAVDKSRECLEPILLEDDRVAAVDTFEDQSSVYYRIVIDYFTPSHRWSSATDNTGL